MTALSRQPVTRQITTRRSRTPMGGPGPSSAPQGASCAAGQPVPTRACLHHLLADYARAPLAARLRTDRYRIVTAAVWAGADESRGYTGPAVPRRLSRTSADAALAAAEIFLWLLGSGTHLR